MKLIRLIPQRVESLGSARLSGFPYLPEQGDLPAWLIISIHHLRNAIPHHQPEVLV